MNVKTNGPEYGTVLAPRCYVGAGVGHLFTVLPPWTARPSRIYSVITI